LCICYTKHALDQFLLDLLDVGITEIARAGGNSRCTQLEEYNLRNLPKPAHSRRCIQIKYRILPKYELVIT